MMMANSKQENNALPYLNESKEENAKVRLNRAIAMAGVCSRRKADELILAGRVKINGNIVANPATHVDDADSIHIDNKPVQTKREKIYILLNKPVEIISTVSDPQKRKTVLDILPASFRKMRIYPVGRLDFFSEGLLILTNDGNFAQNLSHPKFEIPKVYEVVVRGKIPGEFFTECEKGMTLDGEVALLPVKILDKKEHGNNTVLKMELTQGINRQIRRMCDKFSLYILKLKRISQGSLQLGNLQAGEYRLLSKKEVRKLLEKTKNFHPGHAKEDE